MRLWIPALLYFLAAGGPACQSAPSKSSIVDAFLLVADVRLNKDEPTMAGLAKLPTTLDCHLNFIPGHFYGRARDEPFYRFRARPGGTVELNLNKGMISTEDLSIFRPKKGDRLTILPPATRFGRVGTFCKGTPELFLGTNLTGGVMLVYVDRPVSFLGIFDAENNAAKVDIQFSKSGFYWIQASGSEGQPIFYHRVSDPSALALHIGVMSRQDTELYDRWLGE